MSNREKETSINTTKKSEEGLNIPRKFYTLPLDEIYDIIKVDPIKGLSNDQALHSLETYGINELKTVKKSFYNVFIAPIVNLLIILYLISAFAMFLLGEVERTGPTFIILGINALVAIIQQFRAEKQLQALKKLSEATATVLRDGKELTLSTNEIVVGDIVSLSQGDKIPADCRIIQSRNLIVDESSLTGESDPVKKLSTGGPLTGENLPLQDQINMLFFGTFVAAGTATSIVVCVGAKTEIGKISTQLEESTTGDIPLRKKMNRIAIYLGIGVLILLVLSISWKTYLLLRYHDLTWDLFRPALVDSIDLGMKVMPITLPLLITIVLLTGVLAMAKKGVLVREISRTESLGRVSVVCSDKTGTLTKNEMTVVKIWTPAKEYDVNGFGYAPQGTIHLSQDKALPVQNKDLDQMIISGYLNNNSTVNSERVKTLGRGKTSIKWTILGLPTEAALKVLGTKYQHEIETTAQAYKYMWEFNFDSSIKRMSRIYTNHEETLLFTKGATEWIVPLCSTYQTEGKSLPMTQEMRSQILESMQKYASQGYRILSITVRTLSDEILPKNLENEGVRELCEKDLTYLGFVVILDPPRDDVFAAITECKSAGITPIMITGDSISTGKAIAKQLGMYVESQNLAIEGSQLEALSDEDFTKVTVYGRVSPEHKQTIVKRYQNMGKVVAMCGDGVNDALALSMADCGLAMGITGTEVAKEAADMVITDDSFSTIVTGIREGRGLFMKIRIILYFFVCISLMEALVLFSGTFSSIDPFFTMWTFLQLNLLYVTAHMFPSLGFTFGNISKTVMEEKPRNSVEILTKQIFLIMLVQIVLMGMAIASVYYLTLNGVIGHLAGDIALIKARTMAFLILFIMESFFLPLQIRRINHSFIDSVRDINFNKEFLFYLPAILILLLVIYIPSFQTLFEFTSLGAVDWLICLGFCLPAFFGFEFIRKGARDKGYVF